MANSGQKSPATITSESPGDLAWTNPSNATSSDDSYAACGPTSGTSEYLRAVDFSFSIPTAATITGVELSIEAKGEPISGTLVDAFLVNSGSQIGTDQNGAEVFASTDTTHVVGSSSNLWGATLTPAIVNGATFGAEIRFSTFGSGTFSVDHLAMTVYYTMPGVRADVTSTGKPAHATSQGRPLHSTSPGKPLHSTSSGNQ